MSTLRPFLLVVALLLATPAATAGEAPQVTNGTEPLGGVPSSQARVPAVPPILTLLAAGSGTAAAVALLLSEAGRLAVGGLGGGLYARFSGAAVLGNEIRAGILRHVGQHPGVRYEALRKALGLSNGALAFHLRVLEREGYVTVRSQWTRRAFYASGAAPPPAEPTGARDVLLRLAREAPLTQAEAARRLGVSRQLARYHLLALERDGLLVAAREGRAVSYRAATAARLVEFEPVRRR